MKSLATLKRQTSLLVWVIVILLLVFIPFMNTPREWILYLFLFFFYLAIVNVWNLLAGYCGLVSLCQPAFLTIGGYGVVVFTWNHLPIYLGIIVGGIVAALFAAIITIPTFRLKGIFFAIGTLIIPEILRIVFLIWRPVSGGYGGGSGYMIPGAMDVSSHTTYWMALIVGMGSLLLVRYVLRSKVGLGLAAIGDNDMAAASSGVNVFRLKFNVFVMGAFITGVAGAIFYVYKGFILPETALNMQWTIQLMVATVVGGIAILEGPVVGTIIIIILQFTLARTQGMSLLIQGLILIVILLIAPSGIVGTLKSPNLRRSFQKLFTRREAPKQPI